ncbi:MAG TPA: type II toxin-antitoxin system RelE/ParE family toxin [Thermoanaerobaculia bacterium]|nr:type II toxin-antitoxin system RelE/ParE family toxin [Thermoanaerobaculia bacterium]
MKRRAEWTKQALKEAARLDATTRQRILAAIKRLCEENQGDVRRLQGMDEVYRLRVGDWRVIFSYQDDLTILVHRVRPRGDAYKE